MSDELPPPSLRLKPRTKPDADNASSAPIEPQPTTTPAAAQSAAPTEPESPRFKLRPKLDAAATPADSKVEPAPTPALPTASPLGLKPRLSIAQATTPPEAPALIPAATPVPVPPPAQPEQPKFKLKEKSPAPAVEAPPAISASRSMPPPPPRVPPIAPAPVAAAPVARATTPPPFPVVASTSSAKATTPPLSAASSDDTHDPGQSSMAKIVLLVAAVVVLAGAYFGYRKLMGPSTTATPAPVVTEAPKRPTTPSTTLNEISTIPAEAIKKAEAVVAAVNSKDGGAEEVLASEQIPERPIRKVSPKAADKPVAAITSTSELSPGLKMTTTAKNVEGDASPAFRTWVAQARISGVFQGTPPRLLINGRTVPAGQLVDEALEITFEGIDSTTKTLVFRDATGSTVARKF
jgi:hypothetical protein